MYQSETPKAPQKLTLSPRLYGDEIYFDIATTDYDKAKEFFFSISPDVHFNSVGFLAQIDPEHNLPYPDTVIKQDVHSGVANIDVKYLDFAGKESRILSFSFDLDLERVELCKQRILDIEEAWVEASKHDGRVLVQPHITLLSNWGVYSIQSVTYGINSTSPDITIPFERMYEAFMKSPWIPSRKCIDEDPETDTPLRQFSFPADKFQCVSSFLKFKDGSSSDIRISY